MRCVYKKYSHRRICTYAYGMRYVYTFINVYVICVNIVYIDTHYVSVYIHTYIHTYICISIYMYTYTSIGLHAQPFLPYWPKLPNRRYLPKAMTMSTLGPELWWMMRKSTGLWALQA